MPVMGGFASGAQLTMSGKRGHCPLSGHGRNLHVPFEILPNTLVFQQFQLTVPSPTVPQANYLCNRSLNHPPKKICIYIVLYIKMSRLQID